MNYFKNRRTVSIPMVLWYGVPPKKVKNRQHDYKVYEKGRSNRSRNYESNDEKI